MHLKTYFKSNGLILTTKKIVEKKYFFQVRIANINAHVSKDC